MDIADIISWIVVGGIAGVIAKMLMPGKDPRGCIFTIILGIVGAFLAGYLSHLLGIADETKAVGDRGFITKIIFGVVGAFIILLVYRLIAGRRA
jgi:uncharacterized membrane protein YeaQ/YmgE (transglycosylase-associated protein family)